MMKYLMLFLMMGLGLKAQAQDMVSPDSINRKFDHFFMEAMVQRQKGNNDAAFDLLRHCQELKPDAAEVYYFLAQYYAELRDTEKSTAYVKRAASLAPDNETYMETLAQTYIRQQDYANAILVIEGIYERNKDHQQGSSGFVGNAFPAVSANG